MARPIRIEFPGAIYHVTSRGDRRETIFEDNQDRRAFLTVVGQAMDRFDAVVLAYCLMDNHYHIAHPPGEPVANDAASQWRVYPSLQSAASQGWAFVSGAVQRYPGR
jgi:REP element-mobilizing transposase RayT